MYVHGKYTPHVLTVFNIARALDVSPEYLVYGGMMKDGNGVEI